jgi:hypothetical protein
VPSRRWRRAGARSRCWCRWRRGQTGSGGLWRLLDPADRVVDTAYAGSDRELALAGGTGEAERRRLSGRIERRDDGRVEGHFPRLREVEQAEGLWRLLDPADRVVDTAYAGSDRELALATTGTYTLLFEGPAGPARVKP